jgi:hypothetical protein
MVDILTIVRMLIVANVTSWGTIALPPRHPADQTLRLISYPVPRAATSLANHQRHGGLRSSVDSKALR